jgi:catechol 2,3-dioxygenase-like lactoylglutathione lyase family enzyme
MTSRPAFSQLNIVVRDMDAAVRFYRMLGLDISSTVGDWPPGSGARHVDGHPDGGAHLDLDNAEMTRIWAGQALEPGTAVIGFCVPSREAVDDTFAATRRCVYPYMPGKYLDPLFGVINIVNGGPCTTERAGAHSPQFGTHALVGCRAAGRAGRSARSVMHSQSNTQCKVPITEQRVSRSSGLQVPLAGDDVEA